MIDIYRLDKLEDDEISDDNWEELDDSDNEFDWPDEEAVLEEYADALIEQFAKSPEGQALLEAGHDIGFWIHSLIEYGHGYEGFTPPTMDVDDMSLMMEVIFPRKLSLLEPEHADEGPIELIAFWQYLQRVYELPNAHSIIRYLRSFPRDRFRKIMFDPSRAGMAKSFFMQGHQAGFDMADPEDSQKFMMMQNLQTMAQLKQEGREPGLLPDFLGSPSGQSSPKSQRTSKEKSRRKTAKASRKQNRKSKKKKKKRK